jgi:hypothetical protein
MRSRHAERRAPEAERERDVRGPEARDTEEPPDAVVRPDEHESEKKTRRGSSSERSER